MTVQLAPCSTLWATLPTVNPFNRLSPRVPITIRWMLSRLATARIRSTGSPCSINSADEAVGFYGLDLYSLYASIDAVINYLESVDPQAAMVARRRYACLSPGETDPATYGAAALSGAHRSCEREVVAMLNSMMAERLNYAARDGRRFLDAVSNAQIVRNAEHYYRIMYLSSTKSWNLRDRHMFDTLERLLQFHGPRSKAVVWEHNSHADGALEARAQQCFDDLLVLVSERQTRPGRRHRRTRRGVSRSVSGRSREPDLRAGPTSHA